MLTVVSAATWVEEGPEASSRSEYSRDRKKDNRVMQEMHEKVGES